jgi:hypothetical protein
MHNDALPHSEAEAEVELDSDVCSEARIDYENVSAFALQFCFADWRVTR